MAHTGNLPPGEPNFYDIEAVGDTAAKELEPAAGTAAEASALVAVDSAGGCPGIGRGGGFYLAEDEGIAPAAHEVDFAGIAPAEVGAQYTHAMGPHPRGRHKLTVLAYVVGRGAGIRSPGAAPSVQQVQTSGDGVA